MNGRFCLGTRVLLVLLAAAVPALAASTWNVPGDFTTIQEAITNAASGDTIVVTADTYNEKLSVINKDVSLIGAGVGQTVVDAGGAGSCLFMQGVTSAARVEGITFTNGGNVSNGGGIYLYGASPLITHCEVVDNHVSQRGGGLYVFESSPKIEHCFVTGNTATGTATGHGGAGLYIGISSATLDSNTISGNTASLTGGGVYLSSSTATLVNNVVADNQSGVSAGGIYLLNSGATLTNNTVASNALTASTFGGAGILNSGGSPAITNTIVSDNTGADDLTIDSGFPTVTFCNIGSGPLDGEGNISADPGFVGAASGDYHLAAGSLCIDAGTNDAAALPTVDKDGNDRILGSVVDMGAYEFEEGPPPPPDAEIDVKPGTDQNPVSLKGKGVLPVAVLTSPTFDATELDWTHVALADPEDVTKAALPDKAKEEDVDGDGDIDLLLFYRIPDLLDAGALTADSTQVAAITTSDQNILGTDSVRIVPSNK
ncbi:choice-of-anchor Q domain-containing protein [Planctomycetota bacterium]